MAALQKRGQSYRILFWFANKQHALGLGRVSTTMAQAKLAAVETALTYHTAGLRPIPEGVDVVEYLGYEGQPPKTPSISKPTSTTPVMLLAGLRDKFIAGNPSHEETTVGSTPM